MDEKSDLSKVVEKLTEKLQSEKNLAESQLRQERYK